MNEITTINGVAEGRPQVTGSAGARSRGADKSTSTESNGLPGAGVISADLTLFGPSNVDPVERANRALNDLFGPDKENLKLRIEMDEASGRMVIQSVDKDTGEVVQQFPPEEILEVIAFFREIAGLAVDNKV